MRLPLATDTTSRDGTLAKDSLMKNSYSEKSGEEFDVFKRPGLLQAYELGANQGQGMIAWKGTFFTVVGNTLVQGPTAVNFADGTLWTAKTTAPINVNAAWSDGSFVYVFQITGRQVYKTVDGTSWDVVTTSGTGLPATFDDVKIVYHSDGNAYAFPSNIGGPYLNGVYKTTDGGATWITVNTSASWSGRSHPAITSGSSRLWVMGGNVSGTLNDEVWSSVDNGLNWVQATGAAAWANRWRAAATYFDSKLWLVGGFKETPGADVNDVWYSSDLGVTWTQATASAAWAARSNPTLMTYNNRLVVSGLSADDWYESRDGITWTVKNANISGTGGSFRLIGSDNDAFGVYLGGQFYQSTNNVNGGDTYALTGAADLPVSFSQSSGAASTEYLFVKTTDDAWVLTFGQPGTLTQITDVDYPVMTVPGTAYLDGYFFVMTPDGEIHNSALEDPTSWNALDFITAEIEPDTAIALAKHQNYLVAFKDTTTELFYDAANPSGSPLARLSNAALQVGCANGYSIASIDGGLFFLSRYRSNQKSVHYFPQDALSPVEIANPSIKRILTASDTTTVHCFAARLNGHSFYIVTLVTEELTLAYDLTSQSWAQWSMLTVGAAKTVSALTQTNGIATATSTSHGFSDGDPVTIAGATPSGYNGDVNINYIDANTFTYPVSSSLAAATGTITATGWTESYFPFGFYAYANGKDYVQHETSGKIYEISSEFGTDGGAPLNVICRTPPLNQGTTERKSMNRLALVGDNSAGTALVRHSDNDYVTFTNYRQIDLSNTNKQLRRLGDYRERAIELRYTGSNAIRIRALDIE